MIIDTQNQAFIFSSQPSCATTTPSCSTFPWRSRASSAGTASPTSRSRHPLGSSCSSPSEATPHSGDSHKVNIESLRHAAEYHNSYVLFTRRPDEQLLLGRRPDERDAAALLLRRPPHLPHGVLRLPRGRREHHLGGRDPPPIRKGLKRWQFNKLLSTQMAIIFRI